MVIDEFAVNDLVTIQSGQSQCNIRVATVRVTMDATNLRITDHKPPMLCTYPLEPCDPDNYADHQQG